MELGALDVCLEPFKRTIDKSKFIIVHPIMVACLLQPSISPPPVSYALHPCACNYRKVVRQKEFVMDERRITVAAEVTFNRCAERDMILLIPVVAEVKANRELVPEIADVAFVHVPRRHAATVVVVFIV